MTSNPRLSELFTRVNTLLGKTDLDPEETFRPKIPETLEETRLTFEEVERLILKYLFSKGSATGSRRFVDRFDCRSALWIRS